MTEEQQQKKEDAQVQMKVPTVYKFTALLIFIILITGLIATFTSCSALPELFKAADDVITDEAVVIEVDRAAMKDNTQIHVQLDVTQDANQAKRQDICH